MKTIYKYSLKLIDQQIILMPPNAQIISIQMQKGVITLWAIVPDSGKEEERYFWIVGTGKIVPNVPLNYLATVQDGDMVWHVFEQAPIIREGDTGYVRDE